MEEAEQQFIEVSDEKLESLRSLIDSVESGCFEQVSFDVELELLEFLERLRQVKENYYVDKYKTLLEPKQ